MSPPTTMHDDRTPDMVPWEKSVPFWGRIKKFEEACSTAYVTSVEQIGIEQGIEKGVQQQSRRLPLRLLARRFGEPCALAAEPILAKVSDPEQFELLSDWVLDCSSGDEFLDQRALSRFFLMQREK